MTEVRDEHRDHHRRVPHRGSALYPKSGRALQARVRTQRKLLWHRRHGPRGACDRGLVGHARAFGHRDRAAHLVHRDRDLRRCGPRAPRRNDRDARARRDLALVCGSRRGARRAELVHGTFARGRSARSADRRLAHRAPRRDTGVGIAVGALTFTGSIVAWAKLRGSLSGKPLLLPGRHALNVTLAIAMVAFAILFAMAPTPSAGLPWVLAITALAGVLGVHLVMAIGGVFLVENLLFYGQHQENLLGH